MAEPTASGAKTQTEDDVVIASEPSSSPLSGPETAEAPKKKRLGAMEIPGFVLGDAFFEPLPEEELKLWEGEGE